jgi:hypothetical protein
MESKGKSSWSKERIVFFLWFATGALIRARTLGLSEGDKVRAVLVAADCLMFIV